MRGHHAQTALQPEAVNRGSPNCGPPRFNVRPAATFVNYVGTIKITQKFRRLVIPLMHIFPLATRELAYSDGRGPVP